MYVLLCLICCCLCGPFCYLTLQPVPRSFVCICFLYYVFYLSQFYIMSIYVGTKKLREASLIIYCLIKTTIGIALYMFVDPYVNVSRWSSFGSFISLKPHRVTYIFEQKFRTTNSYCTFHVAIKR